MSEPAIVKQRSDLLSILKKIGVSRTQDGDTQAQKDEYYKQLTESIHEAYMEWQIALTNFEGADNTEMVDYYAYQIKASQIRYNYLLKKAKELNTN